MPPHSGLGFGPSLASAFVTSSRTSMQRLFQTRLVAILLAALTLAAIGLAIGNFVQENSYDVPTDGVSWTESGSGLRAYRVPSDSPGDRAGIRKGDLLTAVNYVPVKDIAAFERA